MKRHLEDVIKEMRTRGIKEIGKEDITKWALVFIIEDFIEISTFLPNSNNDSSQ